MLFSQTISGSSITSNFKIDGFIITVIIIIVILIIIGLFRVNCPEGMLDYRDIYQNCHSTSGEGGSYPVVIYRKPLNFPAGPYSDSTCPHLSRPALLYTF